ncbi:ABC transporter permease [Candidatus Micrarchaeota archaeon]|nr:ABC transporter permease [Candidatus Micrarchaeota archaeon]
MNILEMFGYSINSLTHRSLRSWLTILGIVVGITAIVLLVGLVQGLKDNFTSQLSGFGSNAVIVIPTNIEQSGGGPSSFMPSSGKLFKKDVERLKKIPELEFVTPVIMGRTSVEFKSKAITASVLGVDPDIYRSTVGTLELERGRFLSSADVHSAVIGHSLATDSFDDPIEISSNLNIDGTIYRVVGILKQTGNSFSNIDTSILVPFKEAENQFSSDLVENEVSSIRGSFVTGASPSDVTSRIESELISSHRVTKDKKDFSVISADFINRQLDTVTGLLTLFLGGIAGIALLVGGIGIANTMFMSVTERQREIGILKSLGAKQGEILKLFLVESSLIGIAGGVLGILLAFAIGAIISYFAKINVAISIDVALFASLFSGLVGVISGLVPAKNAAKLDPIEALR